MALPLFGNATLVWSTFIGQLSMELASRILASFIFLFIVLFCFKPKIRIAGFLCKVQPVGQPHYYTFKFVNVSYFSAHDVKVELHMLKKIPMGGGEFNNTYTKLSIVNGDISHISGRSIYLKKQAHNPHCIIIRSMEDLHRILSDELSAILLKVSLKHGLTGLAKVFEQEYGNEEDIKKGKFKPGTKFCVI
jgi:hypothetical protein